MHINWIAYYMDYDGYGRFNSRFVKALRNLGASVKSATMDHVEMPPWMQQREGIDWSGLTISCLPPYYLQPVPGRHWLFSMTEGSLIPPSWVKQINESGVERVLVPCYHNKKAFQESGVIPPISIIPGGTDAGEFNPAPHRYHQNYTFLAFADRGFRKGWEEVFEAFYIAFGGKTTGVQDVHLVVKSRQGDDKQNSLVHWLSLSPNLDKRLTLTAKSIPDMQEFYSTIDCAVMPSRSEGWGMPHRELAMMGLPVITQKVSGLDDGYLDEWSLPVTEGRTEPIPDEVATSLGEWRIVDKLALAEKMRWCYDNQASAAQFGASARRWLMQHQTWDHAASRLLQLIEVVNGKEQEKTRLQRGGGVGGRTIPMVV